MISWWSARGRLDSDDQLMIQLLINCSASANHWVTSGLQLIRRITTVKWDSSVIMFSWPADQVTSWPEPPIKILQFPLLLLFQNQISWCWSGVGSYYFHDISLCFGVMVLLFWHGICLCNGVRLFYGVTQWASVKVLAINLVLASVMVLTCSILSTRVMLLAGVNVMLVDSLAAQSHEARGRPTKLRVEWYSQNGESACLVPALVPLFAMTINFQTVTTHQTADLILQLLPLSTANCNSAPLKWTGGEWLQHTQFLSNTSACPPVILVMILGNTAFGLHNVNSCARKHFVNLMRSQPCQKKGCGNRSLILMFRKANHLSLPMIAHFTQLQRKTHSAKNKRAKRVTQKGMIHISIVL